MNSFQSVRPGIAKENQKKRPLTRQFDEKERLRDGDESRNQKRNRQMPEQLRAERTFSCRQREKESRNAAKPCGAGNGKRVYIDSGGTSEVLPPAQVAPVDLAILGVALPDSRKRLRATIERIRPKYVLPSHQDDFFSPVERGFVFGKLTNFPEVVRPFQRHEINSHLILLDYFRPWTIP